MRDKGSYYYYPHERVTMGYSQILEAPTRLFVDMKWIHLGLGGITAVSIV